MSPSHKLSQAILRRILGARAISVFAVRETEVARYWKVRGSAGLLDTLLCGFPSREKQNNFEKGSNVSAWN